MALSQHSVKDIYLEEKGPIIPESFAFAQPQRVGNCAVYNLFQAVRWMFELEKEDFARFNASMLFGANACLCSEKQTNKKQKKPK